MPDGCTHVDPHHRSRHRATAARSASPAGGGGCTCALCMSCGHIGCCDSSPNRHATAHWHAHADHPVIRSFEPGEDWWWCYADDLFFEIPSAGPAPSRR